MVPSGLGLAAGFMTGRPWLSIPLAHVCLRMAAHCGSGRCHGREGIKRVAICLRDESRFRAYPEWSCRIRQGFLFHPVMLIMRVTESTAQGAAIGIQSDYAVSVESLAPRVARVIRTRIPNRPMDQIAGPDQMTVSQLGRYPFLTRSYHPRFPILADRAREWC